MLGTVLESHRHPQHALPQDLVLSDGTKLLQVEWEDDYCGLACIQAILDAQGLSVTTLDIFVG